MPMLLDITRTLGRRYNSTPTGIDRVEFALIQWLLVEGATVYPDAWFIVTSKFGNSALSRAEIAPVIEEIGNRWFAADKAEKSAFYSDIKNHLEQPITRSERKEGVARFRRRDRQTSEYFTYLRLLYWVAKGRAQFRKILSMASTVPITFVHSSHIQLHEPKLFRWLENSSIRSVFYIHDLIPIDYPEFCGVTAAERHVVRMDTASRVASLFLVNSQYTKQRLDSYLSFAGYNPIPVEVSPLACAIPDYTEEELDKPSRSVPYFLCIGTIEGRKNIVHLLNIWRSIADRYGVDAPRLVIVGRRGWQCENVLGVFERTVELSPYVVEISDLSDRELISLMHGSAAILAPSLVEGYSLPPNEACAYGLPVVASDIPVHRELLEGYALLLGPTDGPSWIEAIMKLAKDEDFRRQRATATNGFPRIDWSDFANHVWMRLKA